MIIDYEDIRLLGRLTGRAEQNILIKIMKGPDLEKVLKAMDNFDLDFIRINQSQCSNIRYSQQVCDKCLVNCPVDAIDFIDGNKITINSEICLKCGLCGPACPLGVFEPKEPSDLKLLDDISKILESSDHKRIHFRCTKFNGLYGEFNKNGDLQNTVLLPCLARISQSLVLRSYVLGAGDVIIDDCDENCRCAQGKTAYKQMITLNRSLLNFFGIKKIDEIIDMNYLEENPDIFEGEYDRRDFISEIGKKTLSVFDIANEEQAPVVKHLNKQVPRDRLVVLKLAECYQGGDHIIKKDGLPFAELAIDPDECDFCGVCSSLCPTDALVKLDLDELSLIYFAFGKCTSCDLCVKSCHKNAINMLPNINLGKLNKNAEVLVKHELEKCPSCELAYIKLSPTQDCPQCAKDNSFEPKLNKSLRKKK